MGRWERAQEGWGGGVWAYRNGACGMGRCIRRCGGHVGWGGIWGDVEGKEGLGWCLGRWGGHMRDGLVYGPMGRSHVVVKLSSYLKLSKIIASKIISYIARIKSWDILPVCVCDGK